MPTWITYIVASLGGGGVLTLILFLLGWVRFRTKDQAEVDQINANNSKIDAEKKKVDAEAAKIQADAYAVKAQADVTIVDSAFKLITKLTEDCSITKIALEKSQKDLEDLRGRLTELTIQLGQLQHDLNNEKQKLSLKEEELRERDREIAELNVVLTELKNSK